jgi:hypothetical protein
LVSFFSFSIGWTVFITGPKKKKKKRKFVLPFFLPKKVNILKEKEIELNEIRLKQRMERFRTTLTHQSMRLQICCFGFLFFLVVCVVSVKEDVEGKSVLLAYLGA